MNIVITALGSGGDVFPFIALGQVLRDRGHRVTLLANPHFAAAVAQAGLPLVPLGTEAEYLAALRQPDIWHPRRGFAVLWRQILEWTPVVDRGMLDCHLRPATECIADDAGPASGTFGDAPLAAFAGPDRRRVSRLVRRAATGLAGVGRRDRLSPMARPCRSAAARRRAGVSARGVAAAGVHRRHRHGAGERLLRVRPADGHGAGCGLSTGVPE
jgi:hypothetical protein